MQEAISKQTDIKMTVRKIRRVINLIRGKKATEAQRMLKFMPYFAARIVEKNLNAAIANASEKFGATADVLKISEIFADESSTYRRVRPRAQGRMYKRLKRTSHLTVKVGTLSQGLNLMRMMPRSSSLSSTSAALKIWRTQTGYISFARRFCSRSFIHLLSTDDVR